MIFTCIIVLFLFDLTNKSFHHGLFSVIDHLCSFKIVTRLSIAVDMSDWIAIAEETELCNSSGHKSIYNMNILNFF